MIYQLKNEKKEAFTLIELLVVIAIIALLVSILLPSLKQAKELAKKAVCSSNQHSLSLALNLYTNDHDGIILPAIDPTNRAWFLLLPPWLDVADWATELYARYPDESGDSVMRCPSHPGVFTWNSGDSFPVNYAMSTGCGMKWSATAGFVVSVEDISHPGDRFILADGKPRDFGSIYSTTYYSEVSYLTDDCLLGRYVHPGDGANFLWADGHATYEDYVDWDCDYPGSGGDDSGWWTLRN